VKNTGLAYNLPNLAKTIFSTSGFCQIWLACQYFSPLT